MENSNGGGGEPYLRITVIDEHIDYLRQYRDSESNAAFKEGGWVRGEQERVVRKGDAADKSNHGTIPKIIEVRRQDGVDQRDFLVFCGASCSPLGLHGGTATSCLQGEYG